jgi:precorrin-2 dehydrogenase / sirohydrochlorin ferrochelatase
MSYYPIFVDLSGRKAVVIGGGAVAQRKIKDLLEYGAVVHVISRDLTPELHDLLSRGDIRLLSGDFDESHIEGACIVTAATNDKALNRRISEAAKSRNILVNVVDQPEECSFIVPSMIKRGSLLIAVSTSGKSPALAKKIRETLSVEFGKEYGYFLNIMAGIRKRLFSENIPEAERGRLFHELVDSNILDLIRKQDFPAIAAELERILNMRFSPDDVLDFIKEE